MHQNEKVKYGLIGALVGLSAPVFHVFLHYIIFRRNLPLGQYLQGHLLTFGPGMVTNIFIAGTVFVMGGAGVLVGKLRERDARLRQEIERRSIQYKQSQEELKSLSFNLESKVKEGQDELLEYARKLNDANAKLLMQIEIQRKIAGNVPSLLALVDSDMNYVEMNEFGARNFIDKPMGEILGQKCYVVLGGKDNVCHEDCAVRKAFLSGKEESHSRTGELLGRTVTTENKSIPIKNEEGVVTHVLKIVTDTTAKKKEEDELKRRANVDGLTGVYNKHYLDLYLQNEQVKNQADKRRRCPYTIIYADLDDLKKANDSYGHEAGDILLKKAAQIFMDNTRHEDVIARVGGDEFVIVLPHSGLEEGEVLINRFRRQSEEWSRTKDLSESLSDLTLSVSYGLGASAYGMDLYDTIRNADLTMYRAKKDKK
ncbi:MAG: diguanylate cyclase [Nitrospirota bacterium]